MVGDLVVSGRGPTSKRPVDPVPIRCGVGQHRGVFGYHRSQARREIGCLQCIGDIGFLLSQACVGKALSIRMMPFVLRKFLRGIEDKDTASRGGLWVWGHGDVTLLAGLCTKMKVLTALLSLREGRNHR